MCKVSIVVPVHNTEKYLEESVMSIRKQTLKDIEIILVENASTDNSLELCNKLSLEDKRIKVIHLDKGDLSTARNEGVKIAQADYIGFIDSDDTVEPIMYETLFNIAVQNKLDIVNCNYVKLYPNKSNKYQYCEDGKIHILPPKELVRLNLLEIIPQSACSMLVKKQILENIPFPVDKQFEDRQTTFRFFAESKACAYINTSLYNYYQYRGNICRGKNFKRNHAFAESDSIRLKFICESGMFSDSEKSIIAAKSAESLLRKINRMRRYASKEEDYLMLQEMKKNIIYIPKSTKLSLKARIIKAIVSHQLKKQ